MGKDDVESREPVSAEEEAGMGKSRSSKDGSGKSFPGVLGYGYGPGCRRYVLGLSTHSQLDPEQPLFLNGVFLETSR